MILRYISIKELVRKLCSLRWEKSQQWDVAWFVLSLVFSLFWTRKSSGDRQSSDHTLATLVTQKSKSSFHSIWAVVEAHTDLECNCEDESNATVGHEDKYSPSRLRTYVTSWSGRSSPQLENDVDWRTMASDALRFLRDLDALRPEAVDSEVWWRYPVGIGWKTSGLGLGCVANDVMLANANGHQIRENMLISQWIFPSKGGCFRHESTSRPIVGLFHMPQYVAQKMGFIYLTLLNIYVHMTLWLGTLTHFHGTWSF